MLHSNEVKTLEVCWCITTHLSLLFHHSSIWLSNRELRFSNVFTCSTIATYGFYHYQVILVYSCLVTRLVRVWSLMECLFACLLTKTLHYMLQRKVVRKNVLSGFAWLMTSGPIFYYHFCKTSTSQPTYKWPGQTK